ncbi:vegetative cell wall protein gp1 [Oryza sativa Japonica Group]|uniref:Os05g0546300 protein n=3 Tax=Oryza sativa subsp. japonica TaxID=39947 RepID=B9FHL1_ORYSJ|nr:vegetative cell wall protein gp1 [Oryza sativa Japonica Group]AAT44185.1 unknown protein [Oryza sativa Japonica Group]EEE64573.1 hypothetical protein OsJ_19425 [Oryza sativa Japonica Group]KAF2931937.1 hypothetical protein DAI22_05g248100 [Oryza sativa Japonica Group]BAF18130.1 Os05g0546300 [Oryza sativa Japonica Group]BAG98433.1 unnamed protein product [Oryza sativa Japonica Group]|eukprot:NP_001056216.1 Os05g0546300 [Oryza sativa Japonica Group]
MEASSSPCKLLLLLLLHVVLLAFAPLLQARPLGHQVVVAPLMLPSDGGEVVGGVGRPEDHIPPSPFAPGGPITLAGGWLVGRPVGPTPPPPSHPVVPTPTQLAADDDGGLLRRPGGPTPPSPWHPGVPTQTQLAGGDDGGVGGLLGRPWPKAPPPPDPNTPPVQPLSNYGVSRCCGRPGPAPPTPAGNPPGETNVAVALAPPIPCAAFLRVIRDAVQYMVGGGLGA